jgi:hypothetical protein
MREAAKTKANSGGFTIVLFFCAVGLLTYL